MENKVSTRVNIAINYKPLIHHYVRQLSLDLSTWTMKEGILEWYLEYSKAHALLPVAINPVSCQTLQAQLDIQDWKLIQEKKGERKEGREKERSKQLLSLKK